ncbi:hypothetical protein OB955_20765 [Halobacteria archaeon AArc-m2/3/4]|uniref:DUF7344 domain-containing protein n=1 Tax=Natronoglomus mannanivorans TaxID=2979990 RepID=A0AAP3E2D8_9EURY|nr:hypothetical protein [Halobacteria archaeon AArc-xg1-1]MCU4975136.1 hypothetical protein [Halobacteria archaeon AArc-m2/3/4]
MTSTSESLARSSNAPSTEPSADEPMDLSRDDIFHILQTARRRETVTYLLGEDEPVKMGDVAEHVAARENETTVAKLTSTQRQRVYIPLYQSHLPKLDEVGAIEYDKPAGIVYPTERLEAFRPYLEVGNADARATGSTAEQSLPSDVATTGLYYLLATTVSVCLLLAAVAGLVAIPGLALGVIITVLFVLTTIATTRVRRTAPLPHAR